MAQSIYVPQIGGFIDFKDEATDAEITAYLKSKFPAAPVAPPPAPADAGPDESGILGRFAYGFGRQFTDIPGGIAELAIPAEEAVKTAPGEFSEDARKYLEETLGIDPTKDPTITQQAAQALGSLASFLVPGTAAFKAARALGIGLRGAGIAGSAAASAQGAAVGAAQRGETIRNQLESGMEITPEQQITSQLSSAAIGASEGLPIFRFLGPIGTLLEKIPVSKAPIVERILQNRLSKVIQSGGTEGIQEAVSGVANDIMEYGVYNPDVEIGQDILSNAGTGAFAGSFLEGVIQVAAGRKLRPARQLQEDIGREMVSNAQALRQGEISSSAEELRKANVSGDLEIVEEDQDGLSRYVIKTAAGNSYGSFLDPAEAEEAVNIYKQRTDASVKVRKAADLPSVFPVKIGGKEYQSTDEIVSARDKLVAESEGLASYMSRPDVVKREAARQNVSEALIKKAVDDEIGSLNNQISKLNEFVAAAKPTPAAEVGEDSARLKFTKRGKAEPIIPAQAEAPIEEQTVPAVDEPVAVGEEQPIGAVIPEMPVEEARFIEEAPEVVPSGEEVPPPRTEMRPSATAEDLSALQTELFGAPKNIREMTAEEEARYVAERDKRFPPEPVEVYSAGPVESAPVRRRTLAQAEAEGPVVKDYTPETAQRFKDIYTALKGRFSSLNLKDVDVKLEELISADKNYLIRGQARAEKTPNGIKSIVDLSTGILRPDMTVEQAVKELVETLNHEIIHVLRDQGVLRPSEWAMLSKAVGNTKVPGRAYTYLDKAQAIYTPGGKPISEVYADPDAVIEEAVAEMYKDWVKNANNKEARVVGGLFNRITEFFRRIFRVLKSSKYEGVFKSIEAGEVGAREGVGRDAVSRLSAGPTMPTLTAGVQDANGNVEIRPFPEINEGSSSVYLRRDFKKTKTAGRVRDRAWGAAFDRAFLQRIGRQLDINNPQDYEHIVMSISDEIKHQMKQVQSGVGWYDSDIQDVFDELSKSFPVLKDPAEGPVYRQIFTLIAGVMSNGMKAKANVELAAINFAHFLRTGQFSPIHPFTNKGWNQRSNIMGPQIAMLNSMVSDPMFNPRSGSNNPELERYENFLTFMFSEHSVREINQFRARHGTKSPAKIGRLDDRRLGMYAFGPKFGPFILNLNGMSDETVDSWASRSFYRHMGKSVGADGELIQAPLGKDREAMKRALRDVGAATNLSSRDIQAVLWFYEKELFNQLGQKIPLEVFSDGAREFTRKYGEGSTGPLESRTDREREISGAIKAAGTRYSPPIERAEGKGRFSAAPALSSEEFKKWFAGSKVVERNGNPLVVYHGTASDFKEFRKEKIGKSIDSGFLGKGFYFSNRPDIASYYADVAGSYFEGQNVIPAYISMKNPFYWGKKTQGVRGLVARGERLPPQIHEDVIKRTGFKFDPEREMFDLAEDERILSEAITDVLKEKGYDGVIASYGDDAISEVVAFEPVQVKSTLNPFEPGTAESPRLSAAPLPPYIEAKNRTLFVPEEKRSFVKDVFDFFSGPSTKARTLNTVYGQIDVKGGLFGTRANLARRVSVVDKNAAFEHLEKLANQRDTGNFQRREATQSAIVALGMADRASQLTAASVMMGPPVVEFSSTGDIQSATVAVREDADNLLKIFKTLLKPGPVDSVTGEQKDQRTVFKSYAVAKQAIGRKAAGKSVPRELDDTYINTTIQFTEQNYPEVVEAYNSFQRYNKKLMQAARDSGYLTDALYNKFTQDMNYYGFYREVYEEQLTPGLPSKLAGEIKFREYRGSERGDLIEDPMLVMITNLNFWMGAITRNIAVNKAFKLAKDMGEARLLGASEKPDPSLGESEQVMFFRENGVVKRFAVKDPLLVASLGADDRMNMGRAMKLLGAPTNILRETITRDPAFMIANLIRDTLSSWITSGENITPFIGTVAGAAKALKGTASYHALVGRGVVGSHDLAMQSPAEMAATIRRRALPKNILNIASADGAQNLIMSLWDRLGVWSEASDAATRIAVYESAIAQGMSEAEAAFRAIEIMNFNRRGASSLLNMLTKLVPFLNARIQGLDVLWQAGKAGVMTAAGRRLGERDAQLGKKFLVRGAILAAISVGLEMMLEDDEDYKDLPDYVKNGNLLIPLKWFGIEGGYFAAIAKPFEAGLLFSTIPQEMYKAATGETSNREMAKLFFSEFVSTFGVNPIPQVALPALETIVNYDFYTDLPLISEGKARLAPELQYDSRTSTVAMMLGDIPVKYNFTTGRFEGLSPIVIDQLISGYGGPFGTYLMQVTGLLMEGAGIGPERLPRDITQLPVIKRFLLDAESRNPKSVAQAYELFRVVDEANRSFSRLRQTGDAEATMDYLEKNKDILSYKRYAYKIFEGLNKISAQERRIERDQTMTRDEKLEAMKRLREVRTRLTSQIDEINKALGR